MRRDLNDICLFFRLDSTQPVSTMADKISLKVFNPRDKRHPSLVIRREMVHASLCMYRMETQCLLVQGDPVLDALQK